MFKYTTTLNHLLARKEYRQNLADTTIAFWAETSGTACEELASFFFNPHEKAEEDIDEESWIQGGVRIGKRSN